MKFIITSTLLITVLITCAHATDFHVSNAGNDAWDGMAAEHRGGTSGPWKTLNKVNQQMPQLEGGSVRFRSGDRFLGTLEINQKNIKFGAYGEGDRPILSGARYVSGDWSGVAGRTNVYKYQIPSDVTDVTMVLRENTSLPLGRTPNGDLLTEAGFYTFNDRIQTSVYDPELTDAEKLAGSEIVLRKNVWNYSPYQVTTVEGTTVNFLNTERVPKKRGDGFLKGASYFFQKHLNTLDVDGEWFFDASKHTLYLYADTKPLPKSIQYSARPIVVHIVNAEAIALKGLRIEMAGSMGIKGDSSQKLEVSDCEIALCGQDGISVEASTARIENNNIHDCVGSGISTRGEGRVVITRNNLSNIGLIAGRASGRYGIHLMGGNSEVSYNKLTAIGYIGLRHAGGNNLIRRNIIDTYNLVMYDGGAMYTNDDQKGTIIEENIIRNGMANTVGTGNGDPTLEAKTPLCTGIQCDRKTDNIVIRYNTISFPEMTTGRFSGIHFNFNSMDNLVLGNTILAKGAGISTNDRDPYERAPGEASPPSMSGNRFEENVIVRTSASYNRIRNMATTAFTLKESEQCDVENQGVFLNNVCAVPFTGSKVIMEWQYNCNEGRTPSEDFFATAAEWNDAREYASGNLDAPIRVDPSTAPEDFIQYFYNDSDDPKTFKLSAGAYLDPWGKSVSGSVTVDPWRSVVLFKKL
ncbi:right-handed parallel beta-helix repeat-containing protein [Planctomycetota bacterium]